MNISYNWRDPHAFEPTPPWLDINVVPEAWGCIIFLCGMLPSNKVLGDRTNLGGGIWLVNVNNAVISRNILQSQENGIDAFYLETR